ncbi:MAG: 3-dehydroquinate synthase [Candidatus Melainabacteria bacterium]|nr:3-dehydroquinate synthase [Candidatus Melainabacteria bacterium]
MMMTVTPPSTSLQTVSVALAGCPRTYPIIIGAGVLNNLPLLLKIHVFKNNQSGKVLIVTDKTVAGLYLNTVENSLKAEGVLTQTFVVPTGEIAKTADQLSQLYEACHAFGISRRDVVLALGGGVVGDLSGYAAATYYRGCQFVQVPTTLLAQVDSSVGGKVAVNFKDVKNAIGTFYQPSLVVADTACIETLPQRERLAGLAEMVKYALIEQAALGNETPLTAETSFLAHYEAVGSNWAENLPSLIANCCQLKAAVVARDEQESAASDDATGRVCLNLGHTFAHAYESALGYGVLLHGEAVAIGLMQAFWLAERLHLVSTQTANRVQNLLETLNLFPIALPKLPTVDELVALMRKDKKVLKADGLRFVLPTDPIGSLVVDDTVPVADVIAVLERYHHAI